VTEAAKLIRNSMEEERAKGRPTVYDKWQHYYPPNTKWLPEVPKMNLPGGGFPLPPPSIVQSAIPDSTPGLHPRMRTKIVTVRVLLRQREGGAKLDWENGI
jgi:hypothetical protein